MDLDASLKVVRRIEGLIHKLLDVRFVNPGRTQAHLDLRCVQVLGLGGGQSIYVDGKSRIALRSPLCLPQLPAHVAREVFIGGHIMGCSVRLRLTRHPEDHAAQFGGQLVAGFAGELFHVLHFHTGLF